MAERKTTKLWEALPLLARLVGSVFSPIFVTRLLFGAVGVIAVSWGVSVIVTNMSMQGLTTSVMTLSETVNTVSNDLRAETRFLRSERMGLARDIANQIGVVRQDGRSDDGKLATEIRDLAGQIKELTSAIGSLAGSTKGIEARLAQSESRQEDFERFVFQALLRAPQPKRGKLNWPDQWGIKELPKGISFEYVDPDPEGVVRMIERYKATGKK